MILLRLTVFALGLLFGFRADAQSVPLKIVAAESVYGDIVRQIGGSEVEVVSVLSNPGQNVHLFEPTPSVARAVATADLVVYNGADYDPWMMRLLANGRPGRKIVEVAKLAPADPSGNPHFWYAPNVIPAFADAVATVLRDRDPAHAALYLKNVVAFQESLKPIAQKIADIRERHAGQPVTATEPIFGYMAEALGLEMRNSAFQLAVMNETEPSAQGVAAFEADLRRHRVRVLIHNRQASGNLPDTMIEIAKQAGVPVVPVTESLPPGRTYQQWIMDQLLAVEAALDKTP